jgi:hypothetical protein
VTKYDDFDFYVGEAVASGQPEDNGFTHIGFMLAWLIRRGFGNAEMFGEEIIRQIEDGGLRPKRPTRPDRRQADLRHVGTRRFRIP